MNCPITEAQMIDYLERQLEPGTERQVRSHLETCPTCLAELNELREMRKLIDDCGPLEVRMPDETFWAESLEGIGLATWRRPAAWRTRLNSASWRVLAAAALLVLVFLGSSRLGLFPDRGESGAPLLVENTMSENATARDSLEHIRQLLTDYTLAAEYLQTLEDQSAEFNSLASDRPDFFATGPTGTMYDGLMDLDEDELDGVMLLLAGN